MTLTYRASPAAVRIARNAVRQFALAMGADRTKLKSIAVAVGEACANVAVHAYRHSSTPGEMVVTASMVDGELSVRVIDYGTGMMARCDSPGIGMGLPLMSQLSDSLETKTSAGRGTEVCMRFSLGAGRSAVSGGTGAGMPGGRDHGHGERAVLMERPRGERDRQSAGAWAESASP